MTPLEFLRQRLKEAQTAKGAGDLVAIVAQPIARGIDRVAGTNVAGCGGCKARQEKLNAMLPMTSKPVDEGSQGKGTHEANH